MEVAAKLLKGEIDSDDLPPDALVSTSIVQFAEREFVDAKLARANARNAPKIMEFKLETSVTTSVILDAAIVAGTPAGGISKQMVMASLMTHHITAGLGVDHPKLTTSFFSAIKPVASISLVGSLSQNTSGMNLDSDKAKQTIKNSRALVKELG
eukprot:3173610-Prymnesium_polylepis.1